MVAGSLFALGLLGSTYSLFSVLLHRSGAVPRAVLIPIDPQHYYLAQAIFVGPLFVLLAFVFTFVTRALAGDRSDVSLRRAFEALAPTYAWPLLVLFVLPDLVVFLAAGHAALAPAMRYYAPLAPLAIIAFATASARKLFGVGVLRAALATTAALFAQALVGAPLLR